MLVLTRRIGESVIIGDDTRLVILKTSGNQVQLGVDAPTHVGVYREEVYDRMRGEPATGSRELNKP